MAFLPCMLLWLLDHSLVAMGHRIIYYPNRATKSFMWVQPVGWGSLGEIGRYNMSVIQKKQNSFSLLGQARFWLYDLGRSQSTAHGHVFIVPLKQLMSMSKSYSSKLMIFIFYFTKDDRNGRENSINRLFPSPHSCSSFLPPPLPPTPLSLPLFFLVLYWGMCSKPLHCILGLPI